MVGVIVEDVLVVCGVGRHAAVTWLHVVGGFGLVPRYGWVRRRAEHVVALGAAFVPRERCSKRTV